MRDAIEQLRAVFDYYPGFWGFQDGDSRYLYVNPAFGKLVGLSDHRDAEGLLPSQLPWPASACGEAFLAQDRKVRESGIPMQMLGIHPDDHGSLRVFLSQKIPYFNADHKVIGTIFHTQEISAIETLDPWRVLIATGHVPDDRVACVDDASDSDAVWSQLRPRERELLFLTTRGYTAKQIGRLLNLSHRTVETFLFSLRGKLNATSKLDLVAKARERGYWNHIPQSLLGSQLSVEIPAR
jgi:DNA-binding CsgD family transcriptional regulator